MPLDLGACRRAVTDCFRRRPAFPLAVALVAGIAIEPHVPARGWAYLLIAAAALAGSLVSRRSDAVASLLILAATALAGVGVARWEFASFPTNHVGLFTTDEPRLAEVEVRVTNTPRLVISPNAARPLPPRMSVHATAERILTTAGWQPASGEVVVQLARAHPRLAAGQRLRIVGTLERPAGAMNPGQFDWAAYYRQQRVLATLSVPHVDGVQILADPGPSWIEATRQHARRLLAAGFSPDRSATYALLQALVLGDRDPEMRDAQEDFAHSGAAHLLAVSGLHVVIVAAFAVWCCRLLNLHPRTATCVMMATVLFYGVVVVPGAPALRATILCLAYGAGRLTRRTGDGIQLLAVCAIGLLLYHPHDLYTAGFQLSFLTVLGMLVAGRRVSERLNSYWDNEDARVARSFRPPSLWSAAGIRFRRHVVDAFGIALVAWLVSMPLVMVHFQQVNPWAIPFGLILFPLVALGLLGGVAKILLTWAAPSAAPTLATFAGLPIEGLHRCVHWLASRPAADVMIPAFPAWSRALFYAILLLPLLPWTWAAVKKWSKCAPVAALALVTLPLMLGAGRSPTAVDEVRVTLLSVGAGQIAVIELPGDRTVLIDDGSDTVSEPVAKVLAPYLRTRGRSRVDTIFLSHPDYDHIGGTADTADAFHVRRVVTHALFRSQSVGNPPAEAMLQQLDDVGVPIDTAARGATLPLDDRGDAALDVCWPPAGKPIASTNNAGMVLRLRAAGHTVLFPADIQVPTLRALAADPTNLPAEVLVAPHHGSAEAATADFIAAVKPSVIVSSNAGRLSKKQREFDRLAGDVPHYRTSACGAIALRLAKGKDVAVESFLPLREEKSVSLREAH